MNNKNCLFLPPVLHIMSFVAEIIRTMIIHSRETLFIRQEKVGAEGRKEKGGRRRRREGQREREGTQDRRKEAVRGSGDVRS